MAFVKETVARWANAEDDCRGAFWEKRFSMQKLLTPNAALACSLYIDLNPIRAGLAKTPETSQHTSAYRRIRGMLARRAGKTSKQAMEDRWLAPIHDRELPKNQRFGEKQCRASDDPAIDLTLEQYLELLDFSGREIKRDKPGSIPQHLAPILERLRIRGLRILSQRFQELFCYVVGDPEAVQRHAANQNRRWFRGIRNCRRFFGNTEG